MSHVYADRVKETSTTTGTGTLSLGGAVSAFRTFASGIGTGNTTTYAIVHQTLAEWEVGIGTVTSGTPDTLSRTTILASSNSGSAVSFSAGTKDIFCTMAADRTVLKDASGNAVLGTPASGTLTNCTGLPISTGVSGLAANVATFLATPSSANLAAALTDETGSGKAVFDTSPTITTPTLDTPTVSGSTVLKLGTSTNVTTSPALQFSDDANTGLGHPADDTLTLSTAGTERLRVDSSGNIGVGTSTPGTLMELNSLSDTGDAYLRLRANINNNARAGIQFIRSNGTLVGSTIQSQAEFSNDYGNIQFWTRSGSGLNERMRLNYAGNLGIGTTSPDALLTVNGIASFGDGAASTPSIAHQGDLNTGLWFPAADTVAVSTNGSERLRIDANGNIGVATTSTYTATKLHVAGRGLFTGGGNGDLGDGSPSGISIAYDTSSNTGYLSCLQTQSTSRPLRVVTAALTFEANGGLYVQTAYPPVERMRVNTAGNVGIGTTSPDALLTVNGIASFGDGAASTPSIAHQGDLNTGLWFPAADTVAVSTNGAERIRVDSSGNVLVTGAGGLGYGTGAGGTVTQLTSRTTGVTLNKTTGAITLVSAAGSTSWQSFTVTNSTVAATDTILLSQKSGTDLYQLYVTNVAAGSFQITYATTGGTTTEQPVLTFVVVKAATA